MRDDFDRQVNDGLSHLRSDVERVHWADAEAVRRRGIQRARQRVATGTLAVIVGVGFVGIGAAGGFPGQNGRSPLVSSPSSPTADSSTETVDGSTPDEADGGTPEDQQTTQSGNDDPTSPGDNTSPSGTPGDPTKTGTGSPSPDDDPTSPDDSPSDTPTNTPTTPPDASAGALLTAAQMPKVNDSSYTWSETGTVDGEGSPAPVCAESDLASLGAFDSMRRDFDWGPDGTVYGFDTLGVFESSEDAATAYGSYAGWIDGCTWGEVNGPTEVDVEEGQARWWWVGTQTSETSGEIEVLGLVQRGAAVSVVVWHEESMDFNYSSDPMAAPLQAAADRLAPYVVD